MKIRSLFHVHSDWSYDGKWSLEKISKVSRKLGFRAVFTFEHDRGFTQKKWDEYKINCASLSNDDYVIIPGIEYSDQDNRIHVLVCGVDKFLGENINTNELMKMIYEHKGVAVLAHPKRKSVMDDFRPFWGEVLLGIEIWNRKEDGFTFSQEALKLMKENSLLPFIGLDFHNTRQIFPFWIKIKTEYPLRHENILLSLRNRDHTPIVLGIPIKWILKRFFINISVIAEKFRIHVAKMRNRGS